MNAKAAAAMPYRMKDLSRLTGLPRQAIHFYIQQGLVPEGQKTGRNMAYYGEEHLARIKLVKRLQHERFLPLKAIRAVVGETKDRFTLEQRTMLLEVRDRLAPAVTRPRAAYVDARRVLADSGVREHELREMIALGLVAAVDKKSGEGGKKLRIASDDVWLVEMFGEMRRLGFTERLGFTPKDLAVIEGILDELFEWESTTLTARLAKEPPQKVARMVERAIPLLNTLLARSHERRIRDFFAQLGG